MNKANGFEASPQSLIQCPVCYNSLRHGKDTIIINQPTNYPTLPTESIFLPMSLRYYTPHYCTFKTLKLIETYYKNKWIPKKLYDDWMHLNLNTYKIVGDKETLELWDLRKDVKKQKDFRYVWNNKLPSNYSNNDKNAPVKYRKCNRYPNVYHVVVSNNKNINRKDLIVLNNMFPFANNGDKSKTRLDVASFVYKCVVNGRANDINRAFKLIPMGLNNSMTLMYLIMAVGNPGAKKVFKLMEDDGFCAMGEGAQKEYHSAITVAMRRSQHWVDGTELDVKTMTQCAYWYMSVGRSDMRTDWKQEMKNRVGNHLYLKTLHDEQSTYGTNLKFIALMKKELRNIYMEMHIDQLRWLTWEEFLETRQSWLSPGSSGGDKIELEDGTKFRINKRTSIENKTDEELLDYINQPAEMVAVGSEKYECGKSRAIYGTKIKDYIITTYVIMPLERVLHKIAGIESGVRGEDEVASIHRRMKCIVENDKIEGVMLDYKDFNLQHTLEAQAAVYEVLHDVVKMYNPNKDLIKAIDWLARAKMDQRCTFKDIPGEKRVTQGMFSGQRDTDFTNTILNLAYFRTAERMVTEEFNLRPSLKYNIHKGDDMWMLCDSRLWAACIMHTLTGCGLLMQFSKQLLGYNIGEFLRVVYDKNGAHGYMGRAVASLIIAPLQSAYVLSPVEKASAVNKQILTLHRRGLSVKCCDLLYDSLIPYALRSTIGETDSVQVPLKMASISKLNNGLSINKIGKVKYSNVSIKPLPRMVVDNVSVQAVSKDNTSRAWVRYMSKIVKDKIDAEAVKDKAHKANLSDSVPLDDQVKSLRKHHGDLREWRDKTKNVREQAVVIEEDLIIPAEEIDPAVIAEYNEIKRKYINRLRAKKSYGSVARAVDIINRAIGNSPFKDIDTAIRATGLDTVGAVKFAVNLCFNPDRRQLAITMVNLMLKAVGQEMMSYLLTQETGYESGFEAYLHPIICSWLHKKLVDRIYTKFIMNNERDVNKLIKCISSTSRQLLSHATHVDDWVSLSYY